MNPLRTNISYVAVCRLSRAYLGISAEIFLQAPRPLLEALASSFRIVGSPEAFSRGLEAQKINLQAQKSSKLSTNFNDNHSFFKVRLTFRSIVHKKCYTIK